MKSKLESLLEGQALIFDNHARQAKSAKDKFHQGFFEGKSEQCWLTIDALKQTLTGNPQDILDALNGD